MGLTWSDPKNIANNSKIFMSAPFPTGKGQGSVPSEYVWFIWKQFKKQIGADGLGVKKFKDSWFITYTHIIGEHSFEDEFDRDGNAMKEWQIAFQCVVKKWSKAVQNMHKAVAHLEGVKPTPQRTEADDINDALAEMAEELEDDL